MRITAIVCMLVLLLPAACRSGAGPNVTDGASVPPGAVAVETRAFSDPVASLLYSGVPDRRRDVIRSAAAWERRWTEINAEVTPRPGLPAVDFAQEEVIVRVARSSGPVTFVERSEVRTCD